MKITERKTTICELSKEEFNGIPAFSGRHYETLKPYIMIVESDERTDFWAGLKNFGVMDYQFGDPGKTSGAAAIAWAEDLIKTDYFAWDFLLDQYDDE